ncbi:hypothetical protein [Arcanobacterium phocae]|nr:hypothetical protein [Arcanobacterium phocae]
MITQETIKLIMLTTERLANKTQRAKLFLWSLSKAIVFQPHMGRARR